MTRLGYVALVLHAHLPFAAPDEPADQLALRWLLESLWESYLPLCEMLDRLARDRVAGSLSVSVSPPLAAMLRGPGLAARLAAHLVTLGELLGRQAPRLVTGPLGPAAAYYTERLEQTRHYWDGIEGDVLGVLERHRRDGRLDVLTSAVSHGYLPGLGPLPGAAQAQLRLGRRSFAKLAGSRPVGLWLPECAFDRRIGPAIADAGYGYTILDAHGLALARPRPPHAPWQPVIDRRGTAYFGRDQPTAHQVWSRARGYPGDPTYRDFYRDLGFELPAAELEGLGAGTMTGLKLHRITGQQGAREPYQPLLARQRAEHHADHFVALCSERLRRASTGSATPPVLVAAYDAELFGHWWFEGPAFLEAVLRRLAQSRSIGAVSLRTYLDAHPLAPLAQPSASSWGQDGYGLVWVGPRTAPLWRHVHHAHRLVQQALRSRRTAGGVAGAALDQAVRELMLLESSDWPFMIHGQDMASYGLGRFVRHAERVRRLVEIAERGRPTRDEAAWVAAASRPGGFLQELAGDELRDAFDP